MEESRNTMDNIENAETAINQGPPAGEPERQQYFMERAKRQLAELSARLGRPLTTILLQVNTSHYRTLHKWNHSPPKHM